VATRRVKLYVFYDGWCPLCQKSAKRIERLNWLGLVQFISLRDKERLSAFGLEESNLTNRIQSKVLNSNRQYEGIHTLVQISLRIPLLWIIVPFLYLSILFGVGQRLYDWIASKRKVIPIGQCDEGSCHIVKKSP